MSTEPPAVVIESVDRFYGSRQALNAVSFEVRHGEIFGLLGPNGGGKTTLFRIVSTLLSADRGRVRVFGCDSSNDPDGARQKMGVVFQSFSLDKLLTVAENLRCHGRLYGLSGRDLEQRILDRLRKVGLEDRRGDRVGSLSGGMQRRVEIAKGLLHDPALLLMDEPSTGLDPGARIDLWRYLRKLQSEEGTTIFLTTHLMDEAEKCDRLAILSQGRLAALGSPRELKEEIGGEVVVLFVPDPGRTADILKERFSIEATATDEGVRFEFPGAKDRIGEILALLPHPPESIRIGNPTLEDVFIHRTGHRFWEEEERGS